MPFAAATLATLADTVVSALTRIRGRRSRRLPSRGFGRLDPAVPALAQLRGLA